MQLFCVFIEKRSLTEFFQKIKINAIYSVLKAFFTFYPVFLYYIIEKYTCIKWSRKYFIRRKQRFCRIFLFFLVVFSKNLLKNSALEKDKTFFLLFIPNDQPRWRYEISMRILYSLRILFKRSHENLLLISRDIIKIF